MYVYIYKGDNMVINDLPNPISVGPRPTRCTVSADAWGLDVPCGLDPLGGALLQPEFVQRKAIWGRMEICGLCPFDFAMA